MGGIDRRVGRGGLKKCREEDTDIAQADAVLRNDVEKVKNGSEEAHAINVNRVAGFTAFDSFCSRFCPCQCLQNQQ
jgi:hypothetical protein